MIVPKQENVKSILKKFEADLSEIIVGAWSDWWNSPARSQFKRARTRANMVWELIVDRATKKFASYPDVYFFEKNSTCFFLFNKSVLLKFKKGDVRGLSSNIPTQSALDFHDHDKDLLGLPEVHRIEAVYALNPLETKVQSVLVVGRNGGKVAWKYDILDKGIDAEIVHLSSKIPTTPPSKLVQLRDTDLPSDKRKID